ncbi:MAG: sugar nucleotide-binding protein [Chthoniobacter sp.]
MPRTIVIVGSGGRLGAALLREWRARGERVVGFDRAALDLGDFPALRARLEPLDFEVLVNCAAQTNVDRCEREPEEAFRVNAGAGRGAGGDLRAEEGALCAHRHGLRFRWDEGDGLRRRR